MLEMQCAWTLRYQYSNIEWSRSILSVAKEPFICSLGNVAYRNLWCIYCEQFAIHIRSICHTYSCVCIDPNAIIITEFSLDSKYVRSFTREISLCDSIFGWDWRLFLVSCPIKRSEQYRHLHTTDSDFGEFERQPVLEKWHVHQRLFSRAKRSDIWRKMELTRRHCVAFFSVVASAFFSALPIIVNSRLVTKVDWSWPTVCGCWRVQHIKVRLSESLSLQYSPEWSAIDCVAKKKISCVSCVSRNVVMGHW